MSSVSSFSECAVTRVVEFAHDYTVQVRAAHALFVDAFRGGRRPGVAASEAAAGRVEDVATRPDRSGPAALALRYRAVPRTARSARSPDRRPPSSPNPYAAAM